MEDDKVLNDTQEQAVAVEEVAEASEAAEVEEVTQTEPAKADPPAKGQGADENAKYAAARREAEANTKKLEAQNKRLMEALKGYGYDGSPEEIADNLIAAQSGITPEEAKANREAEESKNAEAEKTKGELEFYKNIAIQKFMADDLRTLQEVYPEVKSLEDIGDEFMSLLTATHDPILCYEAVKAKEAKTKKTPPPEMGSVGSIAGKEKDFYTSEELDKLTSKDLDNPKIFKVAMNSLEKLRKQKG